MSLVVGLASPYLTRSYLARLGVYLALGAGLGLLNVTLELNDSSPGSLLRSFATGLMAGIIYGYLATGWELARRAVAVAPTSSAQGVRGSSAH